MIDYPDELDRLALAVVWVAIFFAALGSLLIVSAVEEMFFPYREDY